LGSFQRRNFALAMAAAEAYLGQLDAAAVSAAAAEIRVPGRLQIVGTDPLTLLAGAHNPDGMAALAESLPEVVAAAKADGPLVAVISILDDKDAAGMLATLLPACDALVLTSSHNPRALPPPTLESLARQQLDGARTARAKRDGPPTELVRDPRDALARARELAGRDGVVLATGSIYLIADLLAPAGERRASML
jgi:dihydrofolate synthase/folylpolyglutamate synthase